MDNKLFITIEGTDKAGKTSVINFLKENQQLINHVDVVFTREPGGCASAEKIRKLLLSNEWDVLTQAYLFAASRNEHVLNTILPALKQNKLVISDRFVDSSYVYQGIAGELGIDLIKQINSYAIHNVLPSLTIVLMLPPEITVKRIDQSIKDNEEINALDYKVKNELNTKIYNAYQQLKEYYPDRIVLINANQSREKINNEVLNLINGIFENDA